MLRILLLTALAAGQAAIAQNATATLSATIPATTITEPCAIASFAVTHGYSLSAGTAMSCLKSVPVDKAGDLLQIQGLQTMLQFQSDLNYLNDPPPGRLYPPVNIMDSLDQISAALEADQYESEYDVQADIRSLLKSAYDFHLYYITDIMDIFTFQRSHSLISLSNDSLALPEVYLASEALQQLNSTSTPSPVTHIDGIDVEQWLNEEATMNPYDHDPDINYNNQFFDAPAAYLKGGGKDAFTAPDERYPGEYTLITLANGRTLNSTNLATTESDFSGVIDGRTFFKKFCTPQVSIAASSSVAFSSLAASSTGSLSLSSSAIASISSAAPTAPNAYSALPTTVREPGPTFYPSPIILSSDSTIGGFFPEENPDLAVVAIPSFSPISTYEFQNTFRTFLATANEAGKSKLLIDLRANGGGNVLNAYDFFKQLFPSQRPYGLQDIAASPLFEAMGYVASRLVGEGEVTDASLQPLTQVDYRMSLTEILKSYGSWLKFFGPVERDGGNFTNPFRYNLSDTQSLGSPIYGYINDTRPQPQTFDPENIVILSDGSCGSTCAVFAEFMKSQAGVQAIVVGGRKQFGPMQWVGGSKGANNQELDLLSARLDRIYAEANADERERFRPFVDAGAREAINQTLSRGYGSVNFHNNYRENDETFTPLQHVYEAADCRFFYTPDMVTRQSLVWQKAYNVRWGDGQCLPGSTGHPSSVSGSQGDEVGYIEACPPEGANATFGANETFGYPGAKARRPCVVSDDETAGGEAGSGGDGDDGAPQENGAGRIVGTPMLTIVALLVAGMAGVL